MAQQNEAIYTPKELIKEWKINKSVLASKCGMNAYTFKMKLLGTYPNYTFTEAEIEKLNGVLRQLRVDIECMQDLQHMEGPGDEPTTK